MPKRNKASVIQKGTAKAISFSITLFVENFLDLYCPMQKKYLYIWIESDQ